jgi:hypothetical protein
MYDMRQDIIDGLELGRMSLPSDHAYQCYGNLGRLTARLQFQRLPTEIPNIIHTTPHYRRDHARQPTQIPYKANTAATIPTNPTADPTLKTSPAFFPVLLGAAEPVALPLPLPDPEACVFAADAEEVVVTVAPLLSVVVTTVPAPDPVAAGAPEVLVVK